MQPTDIEQFIRTHCQKGEYIYPDYNGYSYAKISKTILSLFGEQTNTSILPKEFVDNGERGFDRIVTFFIDGLGYDQILKYADDIPLFSLLQKRASIYPLTAVFPSTTANALTNFYSTQLPLQHGLFEWNLYFEQFGKVIQTLPFRPIGTEDRDTLVQEGGTSETLFNGTTIFESLSKIGVQPYLFFHQGFAKSVYTKAIAKGGTIIPYEEGMDLFQSLREHVAKEQSPTYFHVYWPDVDHAEHEFGPYTPQHLEQLHNISNLITTRFIDLIDPAIAAKTLLILTADHGQVGIDPKTIVYLNQFPEIVESFEIDKNGLPILPCGSSRDVFLHIKKDKLDTTIERLKEILKGTADILTIEEAISRNLFGTGATADQIQRFTNRAGNVLILPYRDKRVWYEHIPGKPEKEIGMHGGLSDQEMLIPFIGVRLSKLQ